MRMRVIRPPTPPGPALPKSRHVHLFSQDRALIDDLHQAIELPQVQVAVSDKLHGDEAKEQTAQSAFLIDTLLGEARVQTLIEALIKQRRSVAPSILLITVSLAEAVALKLIKQFGLRGYVPRSALHELVSSRLEAIFSQSHVLRQNPRVATKFAVHFETASQAIDQGVCTSFSEAGMFIQAVNTPSKDVAVKVKFSVGRTERCEVNAKVLYQVPKIGFALFFQKRLPEVYSQIAKQQPANGLS